MEDGRIIEALEEFVKGRKGDGVIPVTVSSVDEINMQIDCVDGDGNKYLDVRLNATPGKTGYILIPAVNASALIVDLGDEGQEYIMIHAGEIDKAYLYITQNTEVFVNDQFIHLGGQGLERAILGETLNDNFDQFVTLVRDFTTVVRSFAQSQQAVSTSPELIPLIAGYSSLSIACLNISNQLIDLQITLPNQLSNSVKLGA